MHVIHKSHKGKRRKIAMNQEAQDSSADSEEALAPVTSFDGDEGPAMTPAPAPTPPVALALTPALVQKVSKL